MKPCLLKWKQKIESFFKYFLDIKKIDIDDVLDSFLQYVSSHTKLIIVIAMGYIFSLSILGLFCENYECHLFGFGSIVENITKRIDHVTIWLAGLTFLFTSRIWQHELHANKEITIQLIYKIENGAEKGTEKMLELPYKPIRKQCTRAEVQGILGNFYRIEDDKEKNNPLNNPLNNQIPIEVKSEQNRCRYPIQSKKQNYSTAGLSSPAYFKNLKEIELGYEKVLKIYFLEDDWNRFKENIDKFNQQIH